MILNQVAPAIIIVIVAILCALIMKTWFRALLAFFLYLCIVFSATFGMGGLRVSIEQARDQGKSEDFIQGMAARNKQLASARLNVIIFGSGLMVLGILGYAGLPRFRREPPQNKRGV